MQASSLRGSYAPEDEDLRNIPLMFFNDGVGEQDVLIQTPILTIPFLSKPASLDQSISLMELTLNIIPAWITFFILN